MRKIAGGFILKARQSLESDLMDKPPLWSKLWDWMLLRAEWRDGKKLRRGQFHTTIDEMREAMSWHVGYRKVMPTKKEIRSAYEWFARKSDEGNAKGTMIGITKGTRGMVITILNYKFYQDPKNYEGHDEGHDEKSTKGKLGAQDSKEVEEEKKKKDSSLRSESPDNSAAADSSAPTREYPPDLVQFVEGFAAYVVQEHGAKAPKITPVLIARSLDVVDKLMRIDGHDVETVKAVVRWAARDSFWAANALSLAGLRKKSDGLTKFQKILAAYEQAQQKPGGGDNGARHGETPMAAIARARRQRREGGLAHAQ